MVRSGEAAWDNPPTWRVVSVWRRVRPEGRPAGPQATVVSNQGDLQTATGRPVSKFRPDAQFRLRAWTVRSKAAPGPQYFGNGD